MSTSTDLWGCVHFSDLKPLQGGFQAPLVTLDNLKPITGSHGSSISFESLPYELAMVLSVPTMVTIRVRFWRGSLRNGYHIQGRHLAGKLSNPDSGR